MTPTSCSSTCGGMVDRKILRRVAAILYHRRAGFSANGMGVWRVPEDEIMETGARMAAVRGISHCYQRPTYEDWPYSVFTMAHGRSKEECDAILDSIAEEHGPARRGPRRPLLLDRVQEDPPPLLHRRLRRAGRRSTPSRSARSAGAATSARCGLLPGGVNSPVRAMRLDRPRPDLHRARRGLRAGRRRRQPLRRLGLLLGPADPRPRRTRRWSRRSARRPERGHQLRGADRGRGRAGRGGRRPLRLGGDGADDQLRDRGGDERGPAGARGDRPRARSSSSPAPTTATSTACWPRPARAWRRRGAGQPRRDRGAGGRHGRRALERPRAALDARARRATASPRSSPSRSPANMGVVPPRRGLPRAPPRARADDAGALLVFDEVITGFRVARGGAQELLRGRAPTSPSSARCSAAACRRPPTAARAS